jgi:hypothetical protein
VAKASCVAWAANPTEQFRFISTELPVETKRLCLWMEFSASKRRTFHFEFFVFISTHCYAFSVASFNERTLGAVGALAVVVVFRSPDVPTAIVVVREGLIVLM